MHWKNGMAQGFALFSHGAAAGQAIQTINGLVFDDGVVSLLDHLSKIAYREGNHTARGLPINGAEQMWTVYDADPAASACLKGTLSQD